MTKKNQAGQAVVEYLFIFAFMSLIAINFVKGLSQYVSDTQGSLAYYLSQHLSVGVCRKECFIDAFGNGTY